VERLDTPAELYAAVRPDDEIVVYCSNVDCLSSVALYRDLLRRGYHDVRHYSGGLLDWEDAGLPLEGSFVDASRGRAWRLRAPPTAEGGIRRPYRERLVPYARFVRVSH
jgi:3-mercaptopyruvate sulfurtransferase SseA